MMTFILNLKMGHTLIKIRLVEFMMEIETETFYEEE